MPEKSQRQKGVLTSNDKATEFLFVPASNRNDQPVERPSRRAMRMHVMHNYLAKKNEADDPKTKRVKVTTIEGEKMRFRLTHTGLERKYPHGARKEHDPIDDEEDEAVSVPVNSQRLADSQGELASDAILENLELLSDGEPPPLPLDQYFQEEDIALNDPLLAIGLGQIDPFEALPFKLDSTDEVLLHRFQQYERWPWCPINGQSLWSPFAMTDSLVFHATIYTWSLHFRSHYLGDQRQHKAILKHKAATIAQINRNLAKPETAKKDETLAAVVAVTNSEIWYGSRQEALHHMNGVQALVGLRGGIQSLKAGIQNILLRLICWNDLIISRIHRVPLKFPAAEVWNQAWDLHTQSVSEDLPMTLTMLGISDAISIPHDLDAILQDLRHMAQLESQKPVQTTTDHEKMVRMDILAHIERRLHIMVAASESTYQAGGMAAVWRVTTVCSAMYAAHWLRHNKLGTKQFAIWISNCSQASSTLTPGLEEMLSVPPLLLWVRVVSAVCSEHLHTHDEKMLSLAYTCSVMGLDWEGFRSALEEFMWCGETDEKRYSRLWNGIQPLMGRLENASG